MAQYARALVLPSTRRFGVFFKEEDLVEKFQRGTGPGGQAVNKSMNSVLLRHIPTGIVIRTFDSRQLETNRKIARQRLDQKLDVFYNGDESAVVQAKILRRKKALKTHKRNKAKRELKMKLSAISLEPGEDRAEVKQRLIDEHNQRCFEEDEAEDLEMEQNHRERLERKEQELRELNSEPPTRTSND